MGSFHFGVRGDTRPDVDAPVIEFIQALALLAALVALGVMWSPAGAVLVGGLLTAAVLELRS